MEADYIHFVDRFPSQLHYKLAVKYSQEMDKEIDAESSSSQMDEKSDLPSFLTQVEVTCLMAYACGQVLMMAGDLAKDDISLGTYEQQTEVAASDEVLLEEANRKVTLGEKMGQVKDHLENLMDAYISRHTRAATYAMKNAESTDECFVSKRLENQQFRDGITRLTYADYNTAKASYERFTELGIALCDSLDELRAQFRDMSPPEYLDKIAELPSKKEDLAILNQRKKAYFERLKRCFNVADDDL